MHHRAALSLILCLALTWTQATPGTGAPPVPVSSPTTQPADSLFSRFGDVIGDRAAQDIRSAERAASACEWDKAIQLLDGTAERYGRRLLPEADDPELLGDVLSRIDRIILSWPAEGQRVYRQRVDPLARRAREAASSAGGDLTGAVEAARRYMNASDGADVADAAAQRALEAGQFVLATDLWGDLLDRADRRGGASQPVAPLLARLALASAWAGRVRQSDALLGRLVREFPAEPNCFASAPSGGTLADWVRANARPILAASAVGGNDLPMIGGSPARVGFPASQPAPQSVLWTRPYTAWKLNEKARLVTVRQTATMPRLAVMVCPAIVDNRVFVSAPGGDAAADLLTGRMLWHRANPDGGIAFRQTHVLGPTLSVGRVLSVFPPVASPLGGSTHGSIPQAPASGGVVCLDAASGRPIWRMLLDRIPSLRAGFVDPSPVCIGSRVFIVAHANRLGSECDLLCLDAETGRLAWRQALPAVVRMGHGGAAWPAGSLPAADDSTIYVATNMGSVAAVSADTGRVRWVRLYEATARPPDRWGLPNVPLPREWCSPLLSGGRLFVCPPDSPSVLVLEAATGAVAARIPKTDLKDICEWYGLVDGVLIGRGPRFVWGYSLVSGAIDWSVDLGADGRIIGRGQLAGKTLYLPSSRGLLRFSLVDHGRMERTVWPAGAAAEDATVVVGGGVVLVTTATQITCWSPATQPASTRPGR